MSASIQDPGCAAAGVNLEQMPPHFQHEHLAYSLRQAPVCFPAGHLAIREKYPQSIPTPNAVVEAPLGIACKLLICKDYLVALSGIEPELSALRGRRVNQLHHSALKGINAAPEMEPTA